MVKLPLLLASVIALLGGFWIATTPEKMLETRLGAPVSNLLRNVLPETTNLYDLGTSTNKWNHLFVNYASTTALNAVTLCLDGDTCRTTWPTGGGGSSGNVSTSSVPVIGQIPYWTTTTATPALLSTVATGTLSATYPVQTSASRYIIGGDSAISLAFGTTTANIWNKLNTFTNATSTQFTATDAWITKLRNLTSNGFVKTGSSDGTLSVDTTTYESGLTAGDGLTRTVDDFDCDTASASVFGCLTAANWTTFNNKQVNIGATTTNPFMASFYIASSTATSTFAGGLKITGGGIGVLSLNAADCDLKADTSGNFFCGTDANSGSGSWPFTPGTYYGQAVQSTTTALRLNGSPFSLFASSTALFQQASTTLFTVNDTAYVGTGGAGDSVVRFGPLGYEWTIGFDDTDDTFTVSSSTSLGTNNALSIIKSGLLSFTKASSTRQSIFDQLYVGGSATTTIQGTATSTFNNGLRVDSGALQADYLVSCDTIDTDSNGFLTCGSDATGGGGAWPFDTTSWAGAVAAGTSTAYRNTNIVVASTTFFTQASSTQLTNIGSTWLTTLTSALVQSGTDGLLAEYAGSTCTNQFVRALSALGLATCASVSLTADVTGTLPVANGGTGGTTFTAGNVLYGNGTGVFGSAATGTLTATSPISVSGARYVIGGTADISLGTVGIANGGTATTTGGNTNGVTYYDGTRLTNDPDLLFDGLKLTATNASSTLLTATTAYIDTLRDPNDNTMTITTSGNINITSGAGDVVISSLALTNDLSVPNGGTGVSTFTSNGVLYGNNVGALSVTGQGAANSVLTANVGAPSFSASPTIGTSVTTPLFIGSSGGSASAPIYSFSGDANTGMWSPAADSLALSTNGIEYGRITSSGYGAFGTTTSSLGTLTLGSSTAPQLMLSDNTAADKLWAFRVTGDRLYIATSTATATGTPAMISLNGNAALAFGVGTSTPWRTIGFAGTGAWTGLTVESGAGDVLCVKTGGEIVQDDSPLTACSGASSILVKKNVSSLDSKESLRMLLAMNPISYTYKESYNTDKSEHVGFIAEEIKEIEPRLAEQSQDGLLGLRYSEFSSRIVSAIQYIWSVLTEYGNRIERLESENEELRARIEALEARL